MMIWSSPVNALATKLVGVFAATPMRVRATEPGVLAVTPMRVRATEPGVFAVTPMHVRATEPGVLAARPATMLLRGSSRSISAIRRPIPRS